MNIEPQLFFNYKFSKKKLEFFVVSLFWGIFLSYLIFCDFSVFNYTPKSLIISQATQDNVDVSSRVSIYYKLLLFASTCIFLFYFAILKIDNKLVLSRNSFQATLVISSIGLLLIFSDLIGLENSKSILFVAFLNSISIVLLLVGKKYQKLRYVYNTTFFSSIVICSFLISLALLFLFNSTTNLLGIFQAVFYCSLLFILLLATVCKSFLGINFRKIFALNIVLAFIPLLIFFCVEFQFFYFLKFKDFIRYKYLFLGLLLLLSILYFIYQKRRNNLKSSQYFLNKYLAALSLLGFLLLTVYKPFIDFSNDVFELANPANAALRIYKFHEIPLIDFMSSHMISEQFFSWIYFFIFGYSSTLEFTSYFFLADILFYFLAFWFLKNVFKNSVLAFLFLVFFPLVGMLFSDSIFFSIIACAALYKLTTHQTILSYFVSFSSILLLIIWRLDTGIATLFTSLFFLPILFYSNKTVVNYKNLLKGLIGFLFLLLFLILAATALRDINYIKDNFFSALHYIKENQAHGYSKIANNFDTGFYFYHFFIPFICLCCIVFCTMALRINKQSLSQERQFIITTAIFLFLICLSNFQRGLVRHSFFEGSEHFLVSTFFVALSLFFISLFNTERPAVKFILLSYISFVLLLSLKYFGIDKSRTLSENLLTASTLKNIDLNFDAANYKGRIIAEVNSFTNIKKLLDTKFKSNQTFLDFSNTPMLYFFTERKVPGYFCQPLQNSIDDYLQLQLLKKVNTQNTPLVVYSNYPKNWFDETDGVPNSMRQYLVAEYIYKNYKPFSVVDNKCIWIDKKLNLKNLDLISDTVSNQIETHYYKKAAKLIYDYFNTVSFKGLELIGTSQSNYNKEFNFSYFYLPKNINYSKGAFAKVFVASNVETKNIKLILKKDYSFASETVFEANNNSKCYMVRLSNHYLWHTKKPDHIVVECEKGALIEKIEFYYDNRF